MSFEAAQKTVTLFEQRREPAALGHKMPVELNHQCIIHTIEQVLKETPTAFNSQDVRLIVLVGANHTNYWKAVAERAQTEADKKKIVTSILPAMGSILFFLEENVLKGLIAQFPQYAADLPTYAQEGLSMAVMNTWTALSQLSDKFGCLTAHFGAPLRHDGSGADIQSPNHQAHHGAGEEYNVAFPPEMKVPASWTLTAELIFGSIEVQGPQVVHLPDTSRFMVFSENYHSTAKKALSQQQQQEQQNEEL